MGRWDELEGRLDISTQDGFVRKPTTEDLDRFEAETNFKLPDDYREYAVTFGPGTLGRGEWKVRTPGFPRDEYHDLARFVERWRNCWLGVPDEDLARIFGVEPAKFRRMVPFCEKENCRGCFAWDPEEVTDAGRHEYGYYFLSGDSRDIPWPRVASSFREFVQVNALGGGFERYYYDCDGQEYGADEWAESGPIMFSQASVRME